eukprot:8209168-Alexandrium_andersonii.AAC.1
MLLHAHGARRATAMPVLLGAATASQLRWLQPRAQSGRCTCSGLAALPGHRPSPGMPWPAAWAPAH